MPPVMQTQLLTPIDFFIPVAQRLGPDGQPRPKEMFTYSAQFNGTDVLPAGSSVTVGVPFDREADFLILQMTMIATLTNDTTFIAFLPATLELTTTGGGNRLMDQPQHVMSLTGDGELPGVPPWPKFVTGASQLQVTLTNLDLVNAFNVWIGFPGCKVY